MSNKNTELFTQVRIAHRLLAGYYQRIHHLIGEVTNTTEFGLEFCSWDPTAFSRPRRRDSNQLNWWSWDLLPGVQTEYLFLHGDKKAQQPGDWLLVFHVVSDSGIESDDFYKSPFEMTVSPENAHSILRCYIVAPRKPLTLDWYHGIWNVINYPECTDKPRPQCMNEEQQIYATGFEVPMEALTLKGSTQQLVDRVRAYKEVTIAPL